MRYSFVLFMLLMLTGACRNKQNGKEPLLPADTVLRKDPVSINGFWIDSSELGGGGPYKEYIVDSIPRSK